jgi:hypothetical protein
MRDMTSTKQVKRVISPVNNVDDSAIVGQIIDHLGYDAATYVIALGALGAAAEAGVVLLEEGDQANLSDAAAVADVDMVSQTPGTAPETAAGFNQGDDNEVRKLGYIGNKRYTRLTITGTSTGSPARDTYVAAVCILEKAAHHPITQAAS